MAKALRYRLLRSGRMPAKLKRAARSSSVVIAAEGVTVDERGRSLELADGSIDDRKRSLVGAVVLRPDRLLASIDSHLIVDTNRQHSNRSDGTVALTPDGVDIQIDVGDVIAGGSGFLDIHYRVALDTASLKKAADVSNSFTLTDDGRRQVLRMVRRRQIWDPPVAFDDASEWGLRGAGVALEMVDVIDKSAQLVTPARVGGVVLIASSFVVVKIANMLARARHRVELLTSGD